MCGSGSRFLGAGREYKAVPRASHLPSPPWEHIERVGVVQRVLFHLEEAVLGFKMTVTPGIKISDGSLVVYGKTILTDVPDNIVLTSGTGAGLMAGAFIGAAASDSKSLHVFPMGTLR